MKNRIEEEWKKRCIAAWGPDLEKTHPLRYEDLRKTFYAGNYNMYTAIMSNLSDGTEPNPEDIQLMNDLLQELSIFFKEQKDALHPTKR